MKKKKVWIGLTGAVLTVLIAVGALALLVPRADYGFHRQVSEEEARLRLEVVNCAQQWLGTVEGSPEHQQILDIYNSHQPLAQGYAVQIEDNWCAAFASAMAIEADMTDIIPTECGCQRQIDLFAQLECWEETDTYLPQPGDYIFYAWDESKFGDCTGWADHVGIVVGTWGPFIKVIEGNRADCVSIRYTTRFDPTIRGYGLPDYAAKAESGQ